ncbi:hypothetical protein [Shimia thalassica]|uniref:hypothetical protein n=1 Tax=Shimia thalassica TaxID=1715693 RepID=UPI0026E3AB76|nr:hypothetical protein [Shimia thalassica]MDO6482021.1 hypothetical protein [Shimia thalassica]
MDFLATNLETLLPRALQRYCYTNQKMSSRNYDQIKILVPLKQVGSRRNFVSFFGYTQLNGKLIHSFLEDTTKNLSAIDLLGNSGGFGVLEVSNSGGRAFTDISAQYPIFVYHSNGSFILSNNLNLIRETARQNGIGLKASTCALKFTLGTGVGFGNGTSLEDVSLLKPREVASFQFDGKFELYEAFKPYEVYVSDRSYEEALVAAEEELASKVNSILDLNLPNTVVDLSGGVDSRLTLSLFLKYADREQFQVFCSGSSQSPDRKVADYIIEKYGLTPSSTILNNQIEDIDYLMSCRKGVFKYAGMRLKDHPDIGPLSQPNTARISGAYGEMASGIVPIEAIRALRKEGARGFAKTWVNARGFKSSFLTRDAHTEIINLIQAEVQRLLDEGIPEHQLDQVLYYENRSRHHFGVAYRFNNDVRIHIPPLNSISLIHCGNDLPFNLLRHRKVPFDLISRFGGLELAMAPMARDRWSRQVVPQEWRAEYEDIERITEKSAPLANLPIEFGKSIGFTRVHRNRYKSAAVMKSFSRGARFEMLDFYRDVIFTKAEQLDVNDPYWDAVDRENLFSVCKLDLEELLNHSVEKQTSFIGNFANLAHSLFWHTGDVEPSAIQPQLSNVSAFG